MAGPAIIQRERASIEPSTIGHWNHLGGSELSRAPLESCRLADKLKRKWFLRKSDISAFQNAVKKDIQHFIMRPKELKAEVEEASLLDVRNGTLSTVIYLEMIKSSLTKVNTKSDIVAVAAELSKTRSKLEKLCQVRVQNLQAEFSRSIDDAAKWCSVSETELARKVLAAFRKTQNSSRTDEKALFDQGAYVPKDDVENGAHYADRVLIQFPDALHRGPATTSLFHNRGRVDSSTQPDNRNVFLMSEADFEEINKQGLVNIIGEGLAQNAARLALSTAHSLTDLIEVSKGLRGKMRLTADQQKNVVGLITKRRDEVLKAVHSAYYPPPSANGSRQRRKIPSSVFIALRSELKKFDGPTLHKITLDDARSAQETFQHVELELASHEQLSKKAEELNMALSETDSITDLIEISKSLKGKMRLTADQQKNVVGLITKRREEALRAVHSAYPLPGANGSQPRKKIPGSVFATMKKELKKFDVFTLRQKMITLDDARSAHETFQRVELQLVLHQQLSKKAEELKVDRALVLKAALRSSKKRTEEELGELGSAELVSVLKTLNSVKTARLLLKTEGSRMLYGADFNS